MTSDPPPPPRRSSVLRWMTPVAASYFVTGMVDVIGGISSGVGGATAMFPLMQSGGTPNGFSALFGAFAGLSAVGFLAVGVLRILAGFRCLTYRSYPLCMVALASYLLDFVLSLFCCFVMVSIPFAILSLVILLQPPVARAFELRKQGMDVHEVRRRVAEEFD